MLRVTTAADSSRGQRVGAEGDSDNYGRLGERDPDQQRAVLEAVDDRARAIGLPHLAPAADGPTLERRR